jgi:hypothetical protein
MTVKMLAKLGTSHRAIANPITVVLALEVL